MVVMARGASVSHSANLLAFTGEYERCIRSLRGALRRLLRAMPFPINRATDLQQALGIRAPLAWQVFRFTNAKESTAEISNLPLPDAMDRFLAASDKLRICTVEVAAVRERYREFDKLVIRHAGDRTTFDAMVSGLTQEACEAVDLKARRAAFRAAASLWGMQACMTYRCLIGDVAEKGREPLSAIIQGARQVRALRANRSIPVCRRTITLTKASHPDEWVPDALAIGLLEDFCSPNLPRITTKVRGSVAHDFIELSDVGLTARTDVFLATKLGFALEDNDNQLGVTSMIRMPTEEFVADLLAPAGTMDPKSAIVRVLGCMEDVSAAETASNEYLLPSDHKAEYLGRDLDALILEGLPRCAELIRFVLRDMGRLRREYELFRCRVRFPTLHTCIALDAFRPA